ncbi:MAG TPA: hypothetical protein VIJ31_16015, partial [Acidothermaceae bacterium]
VPADAAGRSLSTASGVRPGRVGGDRNATNSLVSARWAGRSLGATSDRRAPVALVSDADR